MKNACRFRNNNNCMTSRSASYNASALDEYANQTAGQIYLPDEQCEIIDGTGSYLCRVSVCIRGVLHMICISIHIYWILYLSQLRRLWYLSHRRPAKAQASLRIRAVSPEPPLFVHLKCGSRRRVRPKIRHLAPLDSCGCAFEEWVYGGRKVPYLPFTAQSTIL